MEELNKVRIGYGLSQQKAADIAGVPLRTYVRYENDDTYGNSLKREMIIAKLNDACEITETKGLLTVDKIKEIVCKVIENEYPNTVDLCYLFGSYAKGYATEKSDVDLCVSTSLEGFDYVGLFGSLEIALHKKIDLIRLNTIGDNIALLNEIMKDGVKIYG